MSEFEDEQFEAEIAVEAEGSADDGDIMTDVNPLADFVKSVESQDFVNAEGQFTDAISSRLQDALDQAKVAMGGRMYGASEEEPAAEAS